ncbi:glutamine-hydrolyzing GMP synthase, partial [Candidatus Peregrinibacteria bacterium]|nr:glutamine-hydrolyzing GMP synthase [Candidatus Peregrinibacteria bacterium]
AVRCLCLENTDGEFKTHEVPGFTAHQLPVKSVGVQGDERTYRHPLVLEGDHDWATLRDLSPKLTNSSKEINRVLFMVAGGPIESVSVTPGYLTKERITTLQEADKLVMNALEEIDKEKLVWQCPTVLLPLSINSEGQESIVLRPISSTNVMTANFTELNWQKIQELGQEILKIPGVSAVFYDITNKPPGTIEWE